MRTSGEQASRRGWHNVAALHALAVSFIILIVSLLVGKCGTPSRGAALSEEEFLQFKSGSQQWRPSRDTWCPSWQLWDVLNKVKKKLKLHSADAAWRRQTAAALTSSSNVRILLLKGKGGWGGERRGEMGSRDSWLNSLNLSYLCY